MTAIGPDSGAIISPRISSLDPAAVVATTNATVNLLIAAMKSAGLMKPDVYAAFFKGLGPLSYWRLGEAVPGTGQTKDEMAAHHGAYVASPTSVAGLLVGDGDKAVAFNGSTQYANIQNTKILAALTNASIVVWFSCSTQTGDRAFYCERSSGNDIYKLELTAAGLLQFTHRDSAGTLNQITSTTGVFSDGARHCAVLTKQGTSIIIYAAGASNKTGSLTGTDTFTDANDLVTIGADSTGNAFYAGTEDEVGIFDRTLTPTEVASIWTFGTTA